MSSDNHYRSTDRAAKRGTDRACGATSADTTSRRPRLLRAIPTICRKRQKYKGAEGAGNIVMVEGIAGEGGNLLNGTETYRRLLRGL